MIAIVEYLSLARMRKLLEHDDALTFGRVPVLTAFRSRRVSFESVLRPPRGQPVSKQFISIPLSNLRASK
jgi:hypothetical protein